MKTALDHLVILAPTLEAGIAHVERQLGVAPAPGGRHAAMGTHNAVLRLQRGVYLEVLAIDPQAPAPAGPRWFGLSDPTVLGRLEAGPYLAHWVVRLERPHDLGRLGAQYPQRLPAVLTMSRGDLHWRIAASPEGGMVPSLIQWRTAASPGTELPDHGLALQRLTGFCVPAAATALGEALDWLDARALIELEDTLVGSELVASIETPAGPRTLK